MFPFDLFWIYFIVPAATVTALILIKIRQEKMNRRRANPPEKEEKQKGTPQNHAEASRETLAEGEKSQTETDSSRRPKPEGCPNYLGYLYMRKASERTHIPVECYNCRELLKCLYSPVVVEKVYGESKSKPNR